MAAAVAWMVQQSAVQPVLEVLSDGVEVSRRVGGGKQIFVLINFGREKRLVRLPHTMKLLMAKRAANSVDLAPYGVELLSDKP